jgi:predicted nucleic acid-binding protein
MYSVLKPASRPLPGSKFWDFRGFNQLTPERQERLTQLVRSLPEIRLHESIIQKAIALRRERKMSLADSIIAATALQQQMPLVTRNVHDYKHVQGIILINPFQYR